MKIKQIAKDYDLKLIIITQRNINKVTKKYNIHKEDLKNNAYVIENEDIILGEYDHKELKEAAFFHEIGHTLITEAFEKLVHNDEMLIEFQAWIEGLKVAKKYNYKFSNKAFEYILTSIHTYYKDALKEYK
jgi:hypothetical protein